MKDKIKEMDEFYTNLFNKNPYWSTLYPNQDEAARWGKICEFMSKILHKRDKKIRQKIRILDVGCGRGWLTRLASIYGEAEGVDPDPGLIEWAQKNYPDLLFYVGTSADLLRLPEYKPYDIIISSEVIEHVRDKNSFVRDLSSCLVPNGYVIVTTPRGEEFQKWMRLGFQPQPVEEWISEKGLRRTFEQHRFMPVFHDRVYLDLPGMSLLHRICASPKLNHLFRQLRITWLKKGMQYLGGIYQVWCFQLKNSNSENL